MYISLGLPGLLLVLPVDELDAPGHDVQGRRDHVDAAAGGRHHPVLVDHGAAAEVSDAETPEHNDDHDDNDGVCKGYPTILRDTIHGNSPSVATSPPTTRPPSGWPETRSRRLEKRTMAENVCIFITLTLM